MGKIDGGDGHPSSPGMSAINSVKARGGDHIDLIRSLPTFNKAKRGFSHTGAKSVAGEDEA